MAPSTTATSRDAILEAALRCFATKGYAATTIKDLASEADVNSALLYYYFNSSSRTRTYRDCCSARCWSTWAGTRKARSSG
jgi:hypothetical protein